MSNKSKRNKKFSTISSGAGLVKKKIKLSMKTTSKEIVSIRMQAAAKEFWPLVKDDKRKNGQPVWKSQDALRSNMTRAFHMKLLSGHQPSQKVIWVDRESALSYVTRYSQAAKSTPLKHVRMNKMPRAKGAAATRISPVIASNGNHKRNGNGVSHKEPKGCLYVIKNGDSIRHLRNGSGGELFESEEAALVAAFKQLDVSLYRINPSGNELVRVAGGGGHNA